MARVHASKRICARLRPLWQNPGTALVLLTTAAKIFAAACLKTRLTRA
jgi:hypothetical protein